MRFLILTLLCASLFGADESPYGAQVERALADYEEAVARARADLSRDLERALRHVPEERQPEIEAVILGAGLGDDPIAILQEIHSGDLRSAQNRVGIRRPGETFTVAVPYTNRQGGLLGQFRRGDQISISHEDMGESGFVTWTPGGRPGNPTYDTTVPTICAVNPRTGEIVPVQRMSKDMRRPNVFRWTVPQDAVYRLVFIDPDGEYSTNSGQSYWRVGLRQPQ